MNDSKCSLIQEKLAWAKELNAAENEHVVSCSSCLKIAHQIEMMTDAFDEAFAVSIPPDFADRVMSAIGQVEPIYSDNWERWLSNRFHRLMGKDFFQYSFASVGIAFAFFNVVHFFSGILLPANF